MSGMKDLLGDLPFDPKRADQLARATDPTTSHMAAEAMIPKLRAIQREVYDVLKRAGSKGLTDWEIEGECGSHGSTYRTRRSELTAMGLVMDTGRKRTILGRQRTVWALREFC